MSKQETMTESHNLPLSLCAGYNSLAVCSCYSTSSVSYPCSHTESWRQQVQLAPFTTHICPHIGRRQNRRLFVLWAASQAGPKQFRWLWLLFMLSHSSSSHSGETARASLCKALPHVCTPRRSFRLTA